MSDVRLTKARVFELDPNKKYVIEVKQDALTREDQVLLKDQIERLLGSNFVMVLMPKGKGLKFTEVEGD